MLELPDFGHMATSTILFESRSKMKLVTSSAEVKKSSPLFQSAFILRRPKLAAFDDIIEIVTMFIKTIFKDSKKVKRIRYSV